MLLVPRCTVALGAAAFLCGSLTLVPLAAAQSGDLTSPAPTPTQQTAPARTSAPPTSAEHVPPPPAASPAGSTEHIPSPPPASAPTPFAHGLSYGLVDAATVRVFAVGGVTTEELRGRYHRRVVAIPQVGHGSGFVIDPRGVIATAAHVVRGAQHVAVRMPNGGGLLPAVVVRRDEELDFAVLLVRPPARLQHVLRIPTTPRPLAVRQTVDVVGYPLDAAREQPQSSRGIISGARDDGRLTLSVSVNPGNSGGPIVDEHENLVGMIIARGNVERGIQGIGIAVPTARMVPVVRAAYDTGDLRLASRDLERDPASWQRAAEIVDVLARFGDARVLVEAAGAAERAARPEHLERFARLADATENASLLALLAAYFWDAAILILERSGGAFQASDLPLGHARTHAMAAQNKAYELATRAFEADPEIGHRSPFLAYLAPHLTNPPRGAVGHVAGAPGVGAAPSQRGWMPLVQAGYVYNFGGGPGVSAHGVQLSATVPFFITGDVTSTVRFALGAGIGFEWAKVDGSDHGAMATYGHLSPVLRVGARHAAFIAQISWSPLSATRTPWRAHAWSVSPIGFRFLAGATFRRALVALTARLHSELDESSSDLALGFVAGTSF
ncbi:MAG: trypsin-like peptidase domain-containing protein [Myxococcales bacterium]|nr:trypsin-like peptidase domain-containing protein [Myxococcales bacterium]